MMHSNIWSSLVPLDVSWWGKVLHPSDQIACFPAVVMQGMDGLSPKLFERLLNKMWIRRDSSQKKLWIVVFGDWNLHLQIWQGRKSFDLAKCCHFPNDCREIQVALRDRLLQGSSARSNDPEEWRALCWFTFQTWVVLIGLRNCYDLPQSEPGAPLTLISWSNVSICSFPEHLESVTSKNSNFRDPSVISNSKPPFFKIEQFENFYYGWNIINTSTANLSEVLDWAFLSKHLEELVQWTTLTLALSFFLSRRFEHWIFSLPNMALGRPNKCGDRSDRWFRGSRIWIPLCKHRSGTILAATWTKKAKVECPKDDM